MQRCFVQHLLLQPGCPSDKAGEQSDHLSVMCKQGLPSMRLSLGVNSGTSVSQAFPVLAEADIDQGGGMQNPFGKLRTGLQHHSVMGSPIHAMRGSRQDQSDGPSQAVRQHPQTGVPHHHREDAVCRALLTGQPSPDLICSGGCKNALTPAPLLPYSCRKLLFSRAGTALHSGNDASSSLLPNWDGSFSQE